MKQFANSNSRLGDNKKKYKRNANWDKAKKIKDQKNQECILVPIKYETNDRPGFMMWDQQETYKEKLPQYFAQPIIECLLFYKDKGVYNIFLTQVSYDRYNLKKKNETIDYGNLNGFMLKADWDDNIISGAKVVDGKIVGTFSSSSSSKKAKILDCVIHLSSYTTVSVTSCGNNCNAVTFTLHTNFHIHCYQSIPPFPIPSDAPPSDGGGGGGDGGYTTNYDVVRNYIPKNAVCQPNSNDRAVMNESLKDALFATGLAADFTGFSFDKAETLAISIGGTIKVFKTITDGIGIAGIAIDALQLGIGVWDGNVTFE